MKKKTPPHKMGKEEIENFPLRIFPLYLNL